MIYSTEDRERLSQTLKGKTIESFTWSPPDGTERGYWVLEFVGGGEMCVVLMAELVNE